MVRRRETKRQARKQSDGVSFCASSSPPPPELFATEHAHVRMLSVLQMIFSKPLEREELLTATELAAIFPNLDELIEMHCEAFSLSLSRAFRSLPASARSLSVPAKQTGEAACCAYRWPCSLS